MESQPDPQSPSIFRQEALEHYLKETEGKGIVRVTPPWAKALFWSIGGIVVTALGFAVLGRVEVNERGRGILRPASGVRALSTPNAGVVTEIYAPSGSFLTAGAPILRLESPQIQGAILEADQLLRSRAEGFKPVAQSQAELFNRQMQDAKARIHQMEEDQASLQRSVERATKRLKANRELRVLGIVGELDLQNAEEQLEAAQRALASGVAALRQAKQDQVSLEAQQRQTRWNQDSDLGQARVKRDSLDLSLRQTLIAAPVGGMVDGVLPRLGDQVQPGQVMAKLVPKDSPLVAIAFLQEKDRAFVKEQDTVQLELNQYPYSEFGTLKGRILRVSADLASPTELQEAFGPGGTATPDPPSFRVEIELLPPTHARLKVLQLRPGMLFNARFTLRRQSLITMAIEPLKRWLD